MRNMTDDSKMYRKLADKANQPYSYLMADIEKGEKDLNQAFKRLRTKEDEIKHYKEENKALKMAVNSLQEDLNKLMNKRKQLDNLQSTLMNIIKGSTTKKISVDFLKTKLTESKRENKFREEYTPQTFLEMKGIGKHAHSTIGKSKKSASKSKSPHKKFNMDLEDEDRENMSTLKRADADAPAWYSALKSNLRT